MSQSVLSFDKPTLSNLWKTDDDWTKLKERQERKKRQNRLNQRAYRTRNALKEPQTSKGRPFHVERFRVSELPVAVKPGATSGTANVHLNESRPQAPTQSFSPSQIAWNPNVTTEPITATAINLNPQHKIPEEALALLAAGLDNSGSYLSLSSPISYLPASDPSEASLNTQLVVFHDTLRDDTPFPPKHDEPFDLLKTQPLGNHFTCDNNPHSPIPTKITTANALSTIDTILNSTTYFPLSSDHLLHLIHFNVFRALISNKLLLNTTTSLSRAGTEITLPASQNLCDGLTLVHSMSAKDIPTALQPTTDQMSIAHSSWLNMFPFPRVRDNLIRSQMRFSHRELCKDLFGELFSWKQQLIPVPTPESGSNESVSDGWERWEDDITANRKGLIVWGEPWDVGGWEVTPGFLRKWTWVLEGCEDMLVASNRWRAKRGEPPLVWPGSGSEDGKVKGSGTLGGYCYDEHPWTELIDT